MRPELRRAIEELGWHTEHPRQAAALLSDDEIDDIAKRGHLTKTLWLELKERMEAAENGTVDLEARLEPYR